MDDALCTAAEPIALGTVAEPDALTLLPEVEVRRALAGRELSLTVLAPPFPAVGVGALRVLRIVERPGAADLVAGYERYERPGGEAT